MEERVILVDENDREIGAEEKLKAHREGLLHRAFSVFIFNSKGELLLQKRAEGKYHSGGLWTNTCCGHPRPGEEVTSAAHRRLKEEMGFDCNLGNKFNFIYKAELDNDLTEHEYDHVITGVFDGEPKADPEEASGWKWVSPSDLKEDMKANPASYTYWFKESLPKVLANQEINPSPKN